MLLETGGSQLHTMNTSVPRNLLVCVSVCVVILSAFVFFQFGLWKSKEMCIEEKFTNKYVCRPVCGDGYFSLYGLDSCHPWLACEDIKKTVSITKSIGGGAVKMVYLGTWQGLPVVVNQLGTKALREDFQTGLERVAGLQPSPSIVQFLGLCPELDTYVTEYHPLGSAERLEKVLRTPQLAPYNTLETRFQLCLNFVRILHFLHASPLGTLVMCDANDPAKALSQFLLTQDLQLVLNDADALPAVNRSAGQLVKCGHRELGGDFVAPEQLWPYEDVEFHDSLMPGYDERVDVWKIPEICGRLLGGVQGATVLKLNLFEIHARCREEKPELRPSAKEVVAAYEAVMQKLQASHFRNHDSL